MIQFGSSVIKAPANGQTVIALRTGQAEYYGLISTSRAALCEQAMMLVWGIKLPVVVAMDASNGISMGSR